MSLTYLALIFKGASWKAPAKGARGNVYSGYAGRMPYGMQSRR